ncbi:MAG: hypothetical protein JNK64_39775 [Myxococcales bacterium]|nr:hypothetical protein [Myxococcales bacterium]
MKNYWIQTDTPVATWVIDVRSGVAEPAALIQLCRRLLVAGREVGILLPPRSSDQGQPDPVDRIQARFDSEGVLDLCRGPAWTEAGAEVSWYAKDGSLVDGVVSDLGPLLETLAPVPGSIPRDFMVAGEGPVTVSGPRIWYERDRTTPTERPLSTTIAIATYSDIWFPFVTGAAHPWADFVRRFDNRELAGRHSPRLNRFLGEARRTAEAMGFSWGLADDESRKSYGRWLSGDGIALDGPIPALMPPGAEDVPWQP